MWMGLVHTVIGVIGGFRRPTVAEIRHHTSVVYYGFKNLKYLPGLPY